MVAWNEDKIPKLVLIDGMVWSQKRWYGMGQPTFDKKNSPPPTIMAEMAVPSTAKIMIDPMFLKKFPCKK